MGRHATRSEVVTIWWRDIPAQVNGRAGDVRHQIVLSAKFQRAIDRAKRKANIYTADDDVAQWRRTAEPCPPGTDVVAAATARAARLEAEHTRDELGRLAYVGGWIGDLEQLDADVDRDDLLALEELGPEDTP
jgi:hypothetical protein